MYLTIENALCIIGLIIGVSLLTIDLIHEVTSKNNKKIVDKKKYKA